MIIQQPYREEFFTISRPGVLVPVLPGWVFSLSCSRDQLQCPYFRGGRSFTTGVLPLTILAASPTSHR